MKKALLLVLIAVSSARAQAAHSTENLFYSTNAPDAIASFAQHWAAVSIIAPQSYKVDARGDLTGDVPARVLDIARSHRIPIVPLIVNPGWNSDLFHGMAADSAARAHLIAQMVELGKTNGYAGWQFDFEQVQLEDRALLTRLFQETARALHANGMTLSIAIYPDPGDLQDGSAYDKWLWQDLVGAYDLKALADAGDFLSLMTYLQHTPRTPPGPIGGLPYMERVLKHALSLGIAPGKLSLGVPFFSMQWYTDWNSEKKGFSWSRGISWTAAMDSVQRNHATLHWDAAQASSWAQWEAHSTFEYAWIEGARALAPKLALAKRYGLRGISVWRIGQEDPHVWQVLPSK